MSRSGRRIEYDGPGGEAAIAAMSEYGRIELGRKTLAFVRRVLQDPEIRERVEKRAAEIRAEEEAKAQMEEGVSR